eukprot:2425092-Rhodomonas_salina.1
MRFAHIHVRNVTVKAAGGISMMIPACIPGSGLRLGLGTNSKVFENDHHDARPLFLPAGGVPGSEARPGVPGTPSSGSGYPGTAGGGPGG